MKSFFRVLHQLVTPRAPIPDPDQYQQSRILASISLAVLLVAFVGIFLSSPSYTTDQIIHVAPVVVGFLLFLIPYFQSRQGHLKAAAFLNGLIASILIAVAALSLGGDVGRDILNYNALIILFSLVFLSRHFTIFFICLDFALIILFGALNPNVSVIAVIRGPLVFNMIAAFFIILLTTFWRRREIGRRQYLQASEREQAQLLLKREQYAIVAQFIEAISHDLRTRLSLIETNRFFVKRLLENDAISESADRRLENIRDIIEDIDQQIGNLNVIVNLGNPVTENVDLNAVVDKVHEELQPVASKLNIQLVKQTIPSSVDVISNFEHLRIAVTHLTQNALTYSNEGDTVTLTVHQTHIQGCIIVNDTGIGIHPDHLSHIFEIFYKTNMARTTTHAGLGLGLTIVKLIAEAYSGTIDVKSEEDEGSTFTLCLPLKTFQPIPKVELIDDPVSPAPAG